MFSGLKADANLCPQILNQKLPLLLLLLAAALQNWCLEAVTKLTLLGYSVALHLCLQRPSIMETQCFCCLCRQGQAGIEGWAAAHSEGRKRIPLSWLSVWSGLPFPSHSPPSSHQTGTYSVTFPVIAFLSPEACRAPWTAGVL